MTPYPRTIPESGTGPFVITEIRKIFRGVLSRQREDMGASPQNPVPHSLKLAAFKPTPVEIGGPFESRTRSYRSVAGDRPDAYITAHENLG